MLNRLKSKNFVIFVMNVGIDIAILVGQKSDYSREIFE